MAQSIKRNFVYNILLNISSVIIPLITAPYVSRVLEPDGIGLYNFANTYAGYFALVALLGIPTYGVREVAKTRDNKEELIKLTSQIMSIAAITTITVSVVYFITIAIIGQLNENYNIFILAGFVIYLAPFRINWFYQGLEDFGFITKISVFVKTVCVVCLFLFVREKNDLVIYITLSAFGIVIADMLNYIKMWHSGIKPRFTLKGLKQHINPLLILFASSIAMSIYTVLDTLMLGFIANYNEVGYYTNAMHVSKVLVSAVTSLSIVVAPRVSYYVRTKNYDKINDLSNISFSFVSFLSVPIAVGLICLSSLFVPLFFGNQFVGSVTPMMILSLLIIFIGLNNLTGIQILIGLGYDKLFFCSVLVGTVSNFLMNIIMIPKWGSVGASIASVIAEFLILAVMIYFILLKTPIRIYKWRDFFKSVIGAFLLIPLYYLLDKCFEKWILVLLYSVSGGFLYLGVEYIFKNSSAILITQTLVTKLNSKKT